MPVQVTHVVGARPNFVKAAPVLRALRAHGVPQRLVHTGQHFDDRLSGVFFRELDLPAPDADLGVGSGTQASQTAAAMVALERALVDERPALLLVYGDVNSTLAAALVAAKLGIPVAHVEAGLRSWNDAMPEEINRRVVDLLSALHFATSPEALGNLRAMGIDAASCHFVGNPMIDTLYANLHRFDVETAVARLGLARPYAVATLHRPANVDDAGSRRRLVDALREVARHLPIVLPLHPRGRAALEADGLREVPGLRPIDPLGYVDFLSLVRGAAVVITDSGGVQEETTALDVPCLTVRPDTERPITVSHGTNRLVTPEAVAGSVAGILAGRWQAPDARPPLWDGRAGERIAAVVVERLGADLGVRSREHVLGGVPGA